MALLTSSKDTIVNVFRRTPTPRPLDPGVYFRFAFEERENDVKEAGDV